jgi:hypothetical protein
MEFQHNRVMILIQQLVAGTESAGETAAEIVPGKQQTGLPTAGSGIEAATLFFTNGIGFGGASGP